MTLKGHKWTEEILKKRGKAISKSKKGKSSGAKGRKHSEETKKKISEKIKLLPRHPKFLEQHLGLRKREQHPLWKGGQAIEVMIRTTREYKNWRYLVFERDNYTCCLCEKRGLKLNADHIIHFIDIIRKLKFEQGNDNLLGKALKYELLWDINNGRTLCEKCHRDSHKKII